jgi:predicted lipoprotein with Yx(FWY)xxD motif
MTSTKRLAVGAFVLAMTAAACSSAGATTAPTAASIAPTAAPATPSAAPSAAAPSAAASSAAASPAAPPAVVITTGMAVEAKPVGAIGTVLVAGNNSMTVYNFAKDTKDSGKSACTGGCLTKWPALTVASEALAVGGTGIAGKLGTIKRDDNGQLQVTYNGLPLYFFQNDKAPGDSNGVYDNWVAVKP